MLSQFLDLVRFWMSLIYFPLLVWTFLNKSWASPSNVWLWDHFNPRLYCIHVKHWSSAPKGNSSSSLAGFFLHLAPAFMKESKAADIHSRTGIGDREGNPIMVSYSCWKNNLVMPCMRHMHSSFQDLWQPPNMIIVLIIKHFCSLAVSLWINRCQYK